MSSSANWANKTQETHSVNNNDGDIAKQISNAKCIKKVYGEKDDS
jgi:hypothetical protein